MCTCILHPASCILHPMSNHTAIILIALGGPRSLEEVGPFMAAFMGRPAPPPVVDAVVERYKLIGGKSPLPEIVKAQAHALEKVLGAGFRVYEGLRYSQPFIEAWEEPVYHGIKRFWTGRQRHVVVVFTSHSIPVRFITAGDPYQRQIE